MKGEGSARWKAIATDDRAGEEGMAGGGEANKEEARGFSGGGAPAKAKIGGEDGATLSDQQDGSMAFKAEAKPEVG